MKGTLRISGGKRIKSPSGLTTRPTTSMVREAVMNLVGRMLENCHWLDLFSGSGVMGCEALQRGAKKVIAIESNKKTAQICKTNLISITRSLSNRKHIQVLNHDVITLLNKGFHSINIKETSDKKEKDPRFNLIYLDPPYGSNLYSSVFESLQKGNWLTNDAIVICEHSSEVPIRTPNGWTEQKRRKYGKSALLLISPPKEYSYDIDSKQRQKGPKA